jgi:hypothetical protein
LTGRSGRIVRYKESRQFRYVRRLDGTSSKQKSYGLCMPKSAEDCDKLNIVEKKKFMDGRKSVVIISDAASTGISLHAAKGSGAAHKRRVHFTIEVRFYNVWKGTWRLGSLCLSLSLSDHCGHFDTFSYHGRQTKPYSNLGDLIVVVN